MDRKDPRKYTCPKCGKDTTCLVWGHDGEMCWDCFDKYGSCMGCDKQSIECHGKGNDKEGR